MPRVSHSRRTAVEVLAFQLFPPSFHAHIITLLVGLLGTDSPLCVSTLLSYFVIFVSITLVVVVCLIYGHEIGPSRSLFFGSCGVPAILGSSLAVAAERLADNGCSPLSKTSRSGYRRQVEQVRLSKIILQRPTPIKLPELLLTRNLCSKDRIVFSRKKRMHLASECSKVLAKTSPFHMDSIPNSWSYLARVQLCGVRTRMSQQVDLSV
ncbi:hypothetical protein R1flu_009743 [Riccia fluitans]|uniref:Uncharacterized protein n=1 Tax=Riccia fluitans TaxID=41844 RepID=A0ABD1Z311_9MARC